MAGKQSPREEMLQVAALIDGFAGNGNIEPYAWDDFVTSSARSPYLEAIRVELATIEIEYPSTHSHEWCSPAGINRLREIAHRIRADAG